MSYFTIWKNKLNIKVLLRFQASLYSSGKLQNNVKLHPSITSLRRECNSGQHELRGVYSCWVIKFISVRSQHSRPHRRF